MEKLIVFLAGAIAGLIATKWYYAAKIKSVKDSITGGGGGSSTDESNNQMQTT